MQMTYYFAWEIRTPYPQSETYNQAKSRIINEADSLGVLVRWRKAKAPWRESKKYHFWEVTDEADALLIMLACGDRVVRKSYLGEMQ